MQVDQLEEFTEHDVRALFPAADSMVAREHIWVTRLVDPEARCPGREDHAYKLAGRAQGVRVPIVGLNNAR